jgi:hypothetical protein
VILALALVAGAALAALPQGTARYRAELGGIHVGLAEVRISCAGTTCEVRWSSRLRLPAEAGGGVAEAGVDVEVDPDGRYRGGALRVRRAGVTHALPGVKDAVPASIVEVALVAEAGGGGGERCLPFFDEERPSRRSACARREGGALVADVGGVAARIAPGADGFPREVVVEGRFRYVRDGSARVPASAPRLAGTRVPGPADPRTARRFCGVDVDAVPAAADVSGLPPPRAEGESCRERTEAWLAAARLRGVEGRTAVGVAWDGRRFVWHAWAEARAGGGVWIPVDPSFGERPARGPRFTLARFAAGDGPARDAAGARILACWGSASVE